MLMLWRVWSRKLWLPIKNLCYLKSRLSRAKVIFHAQSQLIKRITYQSTMLITQLTPASEALLFTLRRIALFAPRPLMTVSPWPISKPFHKWELSYSHLLQRNELVKVIAFMTKCEKGSSAFGKYMQFNWIELWIWMHPAISKQSVLISSSNYLLTIDLLSSQ